MKTCNYCTHFHQHKEIIKDHINDDYIEVDSRNGDCRAEPPRPHWFTGNAIWPTVTTGHTCSHFTSNE